MFASFIARSQRPAEFSHSLHCLGFGSNAETGLCGDSLPLPAPAEQTQCAEAGGKERESRRNRYARNGRECHRHAATTSPLET